jgi:transposase-like protein
MSQKTTRDRTSDFIAFFDDKNSPFCYFKTNPEVIRLAVIMYVRFPLSLLNVEDLLH